MADGRRKNLNWNVSDKNDQITTWDQVQVAILMDIRDELQKLNNLLHCSNFLGIPRTLTGMREDMKKRRVGRTRKRRT